MLQRLSIQNYAIIDDLSINFSEGLNIITGETGAGKSILMGALNLVLGQRADSSALLDSSRKCIIEASFKVKPSTAIQGFFEKQELDLEEETLVRREINPNGKSRSFINDTPASLGQLKELSLLLVDLHQQFDTMELSEKGFQREVIDALAGNGALLLELKQKFQDYLTTKARLEELVGQQEKANKELDYNRFLFDELEELSLKENELEEIEAELKILSNAENIKQQLSAIYTSLKDGDDPLVQQLRSMLQKLGNLKDTHPALESLKERMQSAILEITDVADELDHIDSRITYDESKIELLNERLSSGYKLLKKHGVTSTQGLINIQHGLAQKLEEQLNLGSLISETESKVKTAHLSCAAVAARISSGRKEQMAPFTAKVNKLLVQVGMPNARIKVVLSEIPLTFYGSEDVSILFDGNKSDRFEPLSKVASGGELSRLMLSIKSLVASKLQLPTLIFDEIDTGISGEAARQVGMIMKQLSGSHQLISITHQPQIAARASAHYFVYKEIVKDKIATSIRLLSNDERVTAIARMLSGEKPTAAALENAREMVSN